MKRSHEPRELRAAAAPQRAAGPHAPKTMTRADLQLPDGRYLLAYARTREQDVGPGPEIRSEIRGIGGRSQGKGGAARSASEDS
jgi:hypothetical protein